MNPNEIDANTPAPLDPELQAQAQGELAVPLGVGEFEEPGFDPLAGSESKRHINASVLIIVGVMIVAAGGLFAMKKVAQVAASGIFKDMTEVERIIDEFLPTMRSRADGIDPNAVMDTSILTVLNETYTEHQVPLRDVQKNPFIMYSAPVAPGDDPVVDTGPDPEAERLKKWQADKDALQMAFEQAGRQFRLKSIMGGSRPMAILNDKIVRVGETIESENEDMVFRVTEISTSTVELIGEAPEFELEVTVTVFLQRDR